MPSSIYATWSVIAGEQPTTAKWNILGSNDGAFNTGQGFNDSIILARHLAPTYNFRYTRNAGVATNFQGILICDTKIYDVGNCYSTTTGLFTAPVAGYYIFGGVVGYHTSSSSALITSLAINSTNETIRWQEFDSPPSGQNLHQSGSSEVHLNAGDTAGLYARTDGGTVLTGAPISTSFWGSLRSVG
jgi:hypothetical protein